MILIKRVTINRVLLVMNLVALIVLAVATVASAHGGDTDSIHVCINSESGLARFVGPDEACRNQEYPLDWNIQGPQGPPGDPFLYGQTCPEGQYMTGISAEGYIFCSGEAPPQVCGNGTVEYPEQCDDGNTQNGDGCSASCTWQDGGYCGDYIVDPGEECDDGNNLNGDGCSSTCFLELGCAYPQEQCGSVCVDVLYDPANCGSCGNACPDGLGCFEGACQ